MIKILCEKFSPDYLFINDKNIKLPQKRDNISFS